MTGLTGLCRLLERGSPRGGALFLALLLVVVSTLFCFAPTAGAQVPEAAEAHERTMTRVAAQEFGLPAPAALLGAQVHQESSWHTAAASGVGAEGLAQFMPATAEWIADIYPDLGPAAPYSPGWALRALARYDRHILDRIHPHQGAVPDCDRWAFTLSGYNGGPGWVARDRERAADAGADPDRWWGEVSEHTGRGAAAARENRHYVHRILRELEPHYRRAGWRGVAPC